MYCIDVWPIPVHQAVVPDGGDSVFIIYIIIIIIYLRFYLMFYDISIRSHLAAERRSFVKVNQIEGIKLILINEHVP